LDIVGQYFTHSLDSITIAITHQRKNKKKRGRRAVAVNLAGSLRP
jgi:hypothetical protein